MHICKSAIKECAPLPVSVCVSGAGCATQERVCSRSKLERGRWSTSESTQPPWPSPSNMRGWWRRWRRAYRYIRAFVRRPRHLTIKQGVCSSLTPAGKTRNLFISATFDWIELMKPHINCYTVSACWLPSDTPWIWPFPPLFPPFLHAIIRILYLCRLVWCLMSLDHMVMLWEHFQMKHISIPAKYGEENQFAVWRIL